MFYDENKHQSYFWTTKKWIELISLRSCALYNSYIDPLLNPHLSNNSRDQMKWMVWEMKQIFNAHALCMLGFWLSSEIARRIAFLFLVYEGVFSEKFNGRLWYENNYHNYCCINLIKLSTYYGVWILIIVISIYFMLG